MIIGTFHAWFRGEKNGEKSNLASEPRGQVSLKLPFFFYTFGLSKSWGHIYIYPILDTRISVLRSSFVCNAQTTPPVF